MTERDEDFERIALVSEIVAAYVSNNQMTSADIPRFIHLVYKSLRNIDSGSSPLPTKRGEPVVPIEDSVKPDHIICLEDGRKLKMLKRHLKTFYNMTPEQYRERWDLPSDYPMVASDYAQRRSRIAKGAGLDKMKKALKKAAA